MSAQPRLATTYHHKTLSIFGISACCRRPCDEQAAAAAAAESLCSVASKPISVAGLLLLRPAAAAAAAAAQIRRCTGFLSERSAASALLRRGAGLAPCPQRPSAAPSRSAPSAGACTCEQPRRDAGRARRCATATHTRTHASASGRQLSCKQWLGLQAHARATRLRRPARRTRRRMPRRSRPRQLRRTKVGSARRARRVPLKRL